MENQDRRGATIRMNQSRNRKPQSRQPARYPHNCAQRLRNSRKQREVKKIKEVRTQGKTKTNASGRDARCRLISPKGSYLKELRVSRESLADLRRRHTRVVFLGSTWGGER